MLVLQIAELAASIATAVAVLFAGFQFLWDRRGRRTEFTLERVDRLREHVDANFVSDVQAWRAADVALPDAEFRKLFWSKERAAIRRGIGEVEIFVSLLEDRRLDLRLLTKLHFLSWLADTLFNCDHYQSRSFDVMTPPVRAERLHNQWVSRLQFVRKLCLKHEGIKSVAPPLGSFASVQSPKSQ